MSEPEKDEEPPLLSLVIPVKDEAASLDALFAAIGPMLAAADPGAEILLVNDGSTDSTLADLLARQERDPRIRILDLARNFGKEAALAAGLHAARGRAVITMDADLQDPPEAIPEMVARWRAGAEMVVAVRGSRASDDAHKRIGANLFYKLFNIVGDVPLTPHGGDFRLFDRAVVEAYRQLGERSRFNKGLFAWLGFRQETIRHDRPRGTERTSRWRPLRLVGLAMDGFISFSTVPVRFFSIIGIVASSGSLLYGLYMLFKTLIVGNPVPGYASQIVATLFIGGLNLLGIGILGEYLGRTFLEAKRRPLYLIRKDHRVARRGEAARRLAVEGAPSEPKRVSG